MGLKKPRGVYTHIGLNNLVDIEAMTWLGAAVKINK